MFQGNASVYFRLYFTRLLGYRLFRVGLQVSLRLGGQWLLEAEVYIVIDLFLNTYLLLELRNVVCLFLLSVRDQALIPVRPLSLPF